MNEQIINNIEVVSDVVYNVLSDVVSDVVSESGSVKTKKEVLSAKHQKTMSVAFWAIQKLIDAGLLVDGKMDEAYASIYMFDTIENQKQLFDEVNEKENKKNMKKIIQNKKKAGKAANKVSKPRKANNDDTDHADAPKRGRKKKNSEIIVNAQDNIIAQLVQAANSVQNVQPIQLLNPDNIEDNTAQPVIVKAPRKKAVPKVKNTVVAEPTVVAEQPEPTEQPVNVKAPRKKAVPKVKNTVVAEPTVVAELTVVAEPTEPTEQPVNDKKARAIIAVKNMTVVVAEPTEQPKDKKTKEPKEKKEPKDKKTKDKKKSADAIMVNQLVATLDNTPPLPTPIVILTEEKHEPVDDNDDDDDDDEEIHATQFLHNGNIVLKDDNNILYDPISFDVIGKL